MSSNIRQDGTPLVICKKEKQKNLKPDCKQVIRSQLRPTVSMFPTTAKEIGNYRREEMGKKREIRLKSEIYPKDAKY